MRLPELCSSIDSNESIAIEWKKNLELITKRRERNVSLPKVDQIESARERTMDVL